MLQISCRLLGNEQVFCWCRAPDSKDQCYITETWCDVDCQRLNDYQNTRKLLTSITNKAQNSQRKLLTEPARMSLFCARRSESTVFARGFENICCSALSQRETHVKHTYQSLVAEIIMPTGNKYAPRKAGEVTQHGTR